MNWLKDPLASFLIVGIAVFALAEFVVEDEISYEVVIRNTDIQRLADHWSSQMQRAPTVQELTGVVEQYVKDEIYYRESKRLGLDVNDSIVRRRMVQKLTFLTEDIVMAAPLGEAALREFYLAHQDRYRLEPRYSFSHRYFSVDQRSDAQADARAALVSDEPGDPFMLQKNYTLQTERRIGDFFGRDFASALARLEPRTSPQGPIRSAYGWHTVTLEKAEVGHVPDLKDIEERVLSDARQAAREQANAAYFEDLQQRYSVVYPDAAKGSE